MHNIVQTTGRRNLGRIWTVEWSTDAIRDEEGEEEEEEDDDDDDGEGDNEDDE
jgi:hypothetical protein